MDRLSPLTMVSLNGSPRAPSRTDTLVRAIGVAVSEATGAAWIHMPITTIAQHLMPALTRDALTPQGEKIIAQIESADILILGTPVYRASFTGALKHVLDLVHYEALRGRIAVLAATGANRHHGLVTEHQLRPLASFFGMHTAPTSVYAEEADFDGVELRTQPIHARVRSVAQEVVRLTAGRFPAALSQNSELEEILS
jgi:FMN reductase